MSQNGSNPERRLRAMEAAFKRERQHRDVLEKKYARLKRQYIRLERSHNRLLSENSNKVQIPTFPPETAESRSASNLRASSHALIDFTTHLGSERRRDESFDNALQSARSYGSDDICAESPSSSIESPRVSSEYQEEKETAIESWRPRSDSVYLTPASRRRLHLDFTLPANATDANRAASDPLQQQEVQSDGSASSHSIRQSTHYATRQNGATRTRTRPRLGFDHHSPGQRATRAYGFEVERELEPRSHRHEQSHWVSESPPQSTTPSPVLPSSVTITDLTSLTMTMQSSELRSRNNSDEEASLALARYLQHQENIAAHEEYEVRLLRQSVEQGYNDEVHLSSSSLLSGLLDHQRNIDPDTMSYDELVRLGEEVGDVKKERWRQVAVQVLSSLPTHRWRRGHGEDTCIICQYDFVLNDRALTLPCAHVFHEDCVGGWIRDNNSCPMCKREISST